MATDVPRSLLFDCDAGQTMQVCPPPMPVRRSAARFTRYGIVGVLLLKAAATIAGGTAQEPSPIAPASQNGLPGQSSTSNGTQPSQDPMAHHVEVHMAERRNEERQKTLVADTNKLLALAQQLKADVDKSDKNMLSVDVVKRAEQIEKLARSVKEKMRGN